MKILSLFSGIGAFEKALQNIDENFEVVNYCEIDKYASKAYSIVHNIPESKNLRDITSIDAVTLPYADLVTYGFPCQDISVAGRQNGFVDKYGDKTRSGLFFDALRIIETIKPKYAIAENVKALVGKKFEKEFSTVLESLNNAGYNNYWKALNAKDYGVPQNRERVFIVSIRKDIDKGTFKFPEKFNLNLKLKDLLEQDVDDKYFLKGSTQFFIKNSLKMEEKGNGFRFSPHIEKNACIASTITTKAGSRMDDNFIMYEDIDRERFVFNAENLANYEAGMYNGNGCSDNLRIRKLTPKECWRLMGFDDYDIDKCIESGISDTQLYKQAGNSIVVDIIEEIYLKLFIVHK